MDTGTMASRALPSLPQHLRSAPSSSRVHCVCVNVFDVLDGRGPLTPTKTIYKNATIRQSLITKHNTLVYLV